MTGTPADNHPGWICRIRLSGGLGYTSPRMSRIEAEADALAVEQAVIVALNTPGGAFITFGADVGDVRVRADRILSIEPLPVQIPVRRAHGIEHRPDHAPLTRR